VYAHGPSPAPSIPARWPNAARPIDALALVTRLHLRALCCLAVRQAPRRYSEESLLLIALLRTLWLLSLRAMTDWLRAWPALAFACGLPASP